MNDNKKKNRIYMIKFIGGLPFFKPKNGFRIFNGGKELHFPIIYANGQIENIIYKLCTVDLLNKIIICKYSEIKPL